MVGAEAPGIGVGSLDGASAHSVPRRLGLLVRERRPVPGADDGDGVELGRYPAAVRPLSGRYPASAPAIASRCAGVVPQQPPMIVAPASRIASAWVAMTEGSAR